MPKPNENIEVARITSRQAILVSVITAIAGLAAGYLGKSAPDKTGMDQTSAKVVALQNQIKELESQVTILGDAKLAAAQANAQLAGLKQRVRDLLGPKADALKSMGRSLERMKADAGVSEDNRARLEEIGVELEKIDTKVLAIVE